MWKINFAVNLKLLLKKKVKSEGEGGEEIQAKLI